MAEQEQKLDVYADNEITELVDTKVPTFLKFVYVLLPIWGIIWWVYYWDGSGGFLDRGYWRELQTQARTTRVMKDKDIQPKSALEKIFKVHWDKKIP